MGILSALIGGATSLIAGNQAKKAAKAQAKSNMAMLDKQIAEVKPFKEAGVAAIDPLKFAVGTGTPEESAAAVSRFKASPEYTLNYDNMLTDARKDVEAYGSGSGNLFSGSTLKALQDRAGRISNQLFGNYTSNLFSLASLGANAATNNASNMGAAEGRNQTALANKGNAQVATTLGIGESVQELGKSFANMFGGRSTSYA
jgi:hypothetical protein